MSIVYVNCICQLYMYILNNARNSFNRRYLTNNLEKGFF